MDLMIANRQWASRPADERFWTLDEMLQKTMGYKEDSIISTPTPVESLEVFEGQNGEILLAGQTGQSAKLTHFSFEQFCQKAGAPAKYLRTLPTALTVQNVNTSLKLKDFSDSQPARLLFRKNGGLTLRCITSDQYKRIWDCEVVAGAMKLESNGWRVPPARPAGIANERTRQATEADLLKGTGKGGLSVKVGDLIAPAGLYASDRDCFIFMVADDHCIPNPLDPEHPLSLGACFWNSEVGDASWGCLTFGYDFVCGNHIIWGAQNVQEIRIRHVGRARERAADQLEVELKKYAQDSATEEAGRIEAAQKLIIGANKEESLKALFDYVSKKRIPLTRTLIEEAYVVAEKTPRYGNPNTPWAVASGLTELSQTSGYQDRRMDIDRAAGRVLEMAF